jgi:hypothetical protein
MEDGKTQSPDNGIYPFKDNLAFQRLRLHSLPLPLVPRISPPRSARNFPEQRKNNEIVICKFPKYSLITLWRIGYAVPSPFLLPHGAADDRNQGEITDNRLITPNILQAGVYTTKTMTCVYIFIPIRD